MSATTTTTMSTTTAREFNVLVEAVLRAKTKRDSIVPWGNREAASAADEALESAQEALRSAMKAQPWGQKGAAFMAVHDNAFWRRPRQENRFLYINGRERARLFGDRLEVVSAEQAEAKFRAGKKFGRAREAKYGEQLEELGRLLWRLGMSELPSGEFGVGGWEYVEGSKGGCFCAANNDEDGNTVIISAPGAFRRAAKILKKEGPYRHR